MKAFGFWFLLSLVGTAFAFLAFFTEGSNASLPADTALTRCGNGMTMTGTIRKLKENGHTESTDKADAGKVNLEDYHPIDPVPSSKASIDPGPIQHGTPLIPYIPKPLPPDHPKHGGYP